MGWSIKSPNPHSLATLTEDGKKATIVFSDHEEDTTYEFEYTDDSCGTLTKTFTVKGCSPPQPSTVGDFIFIIDGYGSCRCEFDDGKLETTCPLGSSYKSCCYGDSSDPSLAKARVFGFSLYQKTGVTWNDITFNIEIVSTDGIPSENLDYIKNHIGVVNGEPPYPTTVSKNGKFNSTYVVTEYIPLLAGTYQKYSGYFQVPSLSSESEGKNPPNDRTVNVKITFSNSTGTRICNYTFACKKNT